jgi:hypothetical protein
MKLIPTFIHGVMDYVVALALLVLPSLLGFPEAARWVSWIAGVLILGQALMTNFELGVMPALSMRAHLMVDYLMGPLLAISPWLFGYGDRTEVVVPFVIIGVMVLGQALMTEPTPRGRVSAPAA